MSTSLDDLPAFLSWYDSWASTHMASHGYTPTCLHWAVVCCCSAVNPNPEPEWSGAHKGLALYTSRLLAPVWDNRLITPSSNDPNVWKSRLSDATMAVSAMGTVAVGLWFSNVWLAMYRATRVPLGHFYCALQLTLLLRSDTLGTHLTKVSNKHPVSHGVHSCILAWLLGGLKRGGVTKARRRWQIAHPDISMAGRGSVQAEMACFTHWTQLHM